MDSFDNTAKSTRGSSPKGRCPLISYISARDPLPKAWNLRKRARYSTGDGVILQKYLEDVYGTSRPPYHQRSRSAPPTTQPFRRTFLGRLKAFCRSWQKFERLSPGDLQTPSATSLHLPAEGSAQRGLAIQSFSASILQELCKFAIDVWNYLRWCLGTFWTYMKKPSALILGVLIVLNIFATVYTITHDSFLDIFCPKELPTVRGLVCSVWDELQTRRDGMENTDKGSINTPLTGYLRNDTASLSYELPYYLSHLESTIRSFRSSLPQSEYSPADKELFDKQFTKYIQQSQITTSDAQDFYTHIIGTIQIVVSDTRWLARKLNDTGFSSNVTLRVRGPLAQTMEFFESSHVIYLINGIEPFKIDVRQASTVQAAQLMEDHVAYLADRLLVDIRMIHALKNSLFQQAYISEYIERHVSKLTAENDRVTILRYFGWSSITKRLLGKTLDDYQVEQRRKWLDDMRPVFAGATKTLNEAAKELELARKSCLALGERLTFGGRAARYGWDVSDWIFEQEKELFEGIDALEWQLRNFKNERIKFDKHIFPHRRTSQGNP